MLRKFGAKIEDPARGLIIEELEAEDYSSAYKKLNLHYIQSGIPDIQDYESRIRSIKIVEGTSLTSFIEDLRKGFIEWASLKKIHAEINKKKTIRRI